MAGYKGHIVGGLGLGILYCVALGALPLLGLSIPNEFLSDWQVVSGLFFIAVLFALAPDVDTNSAGQDIFFGGAFVLNCFLIWQGYIEASAYLGIMAMTPIIGKHRGWTHSKLAMILVPFPIVMVSFLYRGEIVFTALLFYGAAVVGYFSHLLLDGKIFKWFRIKT